jgi:hypothetical protein
MTYRSFVHSWRYPAHLPLAVVLSTSLVSVSDAVLPTGSAGPTCVGDCDSSGAVTVDELVRGVGHRGSLGNADGRFNSVTAVAVDPNGTVLTTDVNERVQRFACSPSSSAPTS